MKRYISAVLLVAALLFGSATPGFARGHGGGFHGGFHGHGFHHGGHVFARNRVFIGNPFFFGDPFWWGPAYVAPPVVIQSAPPTYIQQAPPGSAYWYYCQKPQGYYPYVKECPGGWLTVVPPGQ